MPAPPCKLDCTCGKHTKTTAGRPCPVGCTCDRHQHEGRSCLPGCACDRHKQSVKQIQSASTRQRWASGEFADREPHFCSASCTCGKHRSRPNNFHGGQTGEDFAVVLCPAGYVREYPLFCAGRRYTLDFAHLASRTNIELDGPHHYTTEAEDLVRDGRLRSLGWRIIRIKHE